MIAVLFLSSSGHLPPGRWLLFHVLTSSHTGKVHPETYEALLKITEGNKLGEADASNLDVYDA